VGASILNDMLPVARAAPAWLAMLLASQLGAAAELKQGELTYNADKINSQLRTDTMELIGNVSFAQGQSSITADRAHVKASGENDTQWRFEGSVRVRTIEAELRADTVNANIVKGQLSTARAEGSPAEFEQLSGAADGRGQGRANLIEYDVGTGVVKLTGGAEQVWFVYGKEKNEFRTDTLTYDMRTGTVSTGRTRGTIRLNAKPGSAAEVPGGSAKRGDGA
jgi:lipopolysaccharide transport protein LptA